MRCPTCEFENPGAARFCGGCGLELEPACEACGERLTPSVRFCTACGHAVEGSGAGVDAGVAERRRVSVLFVDLVGFTELAERLDPEEVRAIQARYFELARSVIAIHGGTVEKFIGDAVMAVWGAPAAHEDDAERAVRAALTIVDGVGRLGLAPDRRDLGARAAVTSGEAAVTIGAVGQGMVAGDLVNGAARLQGEAPAGGVLVDDATRRLAEDAAAFEPVGALRLRGRHEPVVAHRASPVARSWPGRRRGLHAGPFVGRERELGELVGLFDAVATGRRSRFVLVTGIAGIGKSRLAWELGEQLEPRPELVAWHAGRAPAYGEEITFAAVAEMVRARLHISDGADRELTLRQLGTGLGEFVESDDDERRWIEPRIGALLVGDDDRAFQRDELFAAWRRFFELVAAAAPTVLVFEDLQWADPALLAFIEHLATWAREHPILVVALARPEMLDRVPGWGSAIPSFTRIHLERLADAAMRELLLDRSPDLPEEAVRRILEHAGGVPLYAVEISRILDADAVRAREQESGVTSLSSTPSRATEVPESLQGVIAARIDALPDGERRLLLSAAVLGRRFDLAALEAVSVVGSRALREHVDGLVRHELLAIDDDPRTPGIGMLGFVQDLVREVAYRRLGRDERRTLHLAAARHLEGRPDDEEAESLAAHLVAAHAIAPDHPDARRIARRAVGALRRAAQRSLARHLPERAVGLIEQALGLSDETSRRQILDEAAAAARAADQLELAAAHLRELAALHRDGGDRQAAAGARARLASVLLLAQRNEPAVAELEAALRAHRRVLSDPVAAELAAQLARARMIIGDHAAALDWAERALEAARRLDLPGLATDLLVTRGTARWRLGDQEGGMSDLRQAIGDARSTALFGIETRARSNLAWLVVTDDPRLSSETAREAVELATRMGVGDMAVQAATVACAVAIDTGDWDWALETATKLVARPIAEAHRFDLAATSGIIRVMRGEPDPLAELEVVAAQVADPDPQLAAAADHARAWAALVAGDLERAASLSEHAAASAFSADRVHYLALAGRTALWRGDATDAERLASEIEATPPPGRATSAAAMTVRAGVALLAGRDDGPRLHADAVERWQSLGLAPHAGLALIDVHRITGRPEAAEGAREILAGLDARGLLGLLDPAPRDTACSPRRRRSS